ncbi:MAG: DUF4325 domain-containing protein [Candidatus Babeliales bacterium]
MKSKNKTHIVKVNELVGPYCVTSSDGKATSNQLIHLVESGDQLIFDFKNVDIFSTSYFKGLFNCLHSEKDIREIEERIKTLNISELGDKIFTQVLESFKYSLNHPNSTSIIVDDLINSEVNSL